MRSKLSGLVLLGLLGVASLAAAQSGESGESGEGEPPAQERDAAQSARGESPAQESANDTKGEEERESPMEFRPTEEVMADTTLTLPSDI